MQSKPLIALLKKIFYFFKGILSTLLEEKKVFCVINKINFCTRLFLKLHLNLTFLCILYNFIIK